MSGGDVKRLVGQQPGSQNQQVPPPSGPNLQMAPQAVEQNGLLQRQLQAEPTLNPGPANAPSKMQGLLGAMQSSPGLQAIAQAPMSGGAGFQPMNPTQDPNVAATMQSLQGLLADSKQKKMMFAKAMMGGG